MNYTHDRLESYYESLLLEYTTGCLSDALSLAVAAHLELSVTARQYVSDMEAVGGALLEAETEQFDISNSCLDSLLERIENDARRSEVHIMHKKANSLCNLPEDLTRCTLPNILKSYLGQQARSVKWKKLSSGIRAIDIKSAEKGTKIMLLNIDAGKPTPHHGHQGLEATLVLNGSFSDETGHHGAGDLVVLDDTIEHRPVAHKTDGCICLSVTTAPVRFTGLMGVFLNPFLML